MSTWKSLAEIEFTNQADTVVVIDGDNPKQIPKEQLEKEIADSITTDKTLTEEDMAADAKAVGEAVQNVQKAINEEKKGRIEEDKTLATQIARNVSSIESTNRTITRIAERTSVSEVEIHTLKEDVRQAQIDISNIDNQVDQQIVDIQQLDNKNKDTNRRIDNFALNAKEGYVPTANGNGTWSWQEQQGQGQYEAGANINIDGNVISADVPTNISAFRNDMNYAQRSEVAKKADLADVNTLANDVNNLSIKATKASDTATEAKAIALGKSKGYVFDTVDDMLNWVSYHSPELVVGDNLYIRAVDVPDYWWDGATPQQLETQKVDLSDYATKEDLDDLDDIVVKTVNGKSPDENGNVDVESGGGTVTDVQINGTSVLSDGVANIPIASSNSLGAVMSGRSTDGLTIESSGYIRVNAASNGDITKRSGSNRPITIGNLDFAVKSALTDAKAVTYTDSEKESAKARLGIIDGNVSDVQVNGTSVLTDGIANIPMAKSGAFGVIKPTVSSGFNVNSSGELTAYNENGYIDNRYGGRPLALNKLDYAVKAALTDKKSKELTWTDAEKASARNRIGALSCDYSEEEQEIGTWIDGKKIYQKTLKITGSDIVGNTVTKELPSGVENVMIVNGFYRLASGAMIPINLFMNGSQYVYTVVTVADSGNYALFSAFNGLSAQGGYITIQYIKS